MKRNKNNKPSSPSWGLGSFYIAALIATLYGLDIEAQTINLAPRLVVNITVDQLRTDYLEHFSPLYKQDGFRRLLQEGRVYEGGSYPFSPVDRASAIACVATGATPQYNKIISQQWLNRETLRPEYCVYDRKNVVSPAHMATSTVSDELKVSTEGRALVFGLAQSQDAAILSAGHAANGAFWINDITAEWTTSAYYPKEAQAWTKAYNAQTEKQRGELVNDAIAKAAISCVADNALGKDNITDYLAVTLSASLGTSMGQRAEMEGVYTSLDITLGTLIKGIEEQVGADNVMFVLTATGYTEEPDIDYEKYHIPTGTFYINRTAHLLNMYLSAVYGTGNWVEAYFKNQIYLNHKLIENSKASYSEVVQRSKDLLMMTSGVAAVEDSPYDTAISGDLRVEVTPGWKIYNEDTNESYQARTAFVPFPIIFLGANIKAEHVKEQITTERIAPTIAKCIHIRAPNACSAAPLF
jgi:hypothetical protein